MKKRILAIFLVMAALTSLLCGCGEATGQSGISSDETTASSGENQTKNWMTVGISQDLDDSLDPYMWTGAGTREVMFNVFEGLVKPNAAGDFVEAVASACTISEDGLTYTFTLRDGVVFHNGDPCTMEDVVYSFETCAATSTTPSVVEALSHITAMETDGMDLAITLDEPNTDFISIVSCVYIVPADYTSQNTAPIGTGPFRFVSRSVQENVVLEKHTDYYGEPAHLNGVTYKIYEDANARYTALQSGALDLMVHMTSDEVNNLSNGYTVLEGTMNLVQALYLNHAVAPFDNETVRQALCYAVNVDELMEISADGHGTKIGSSMYPNFTKYFDAELSERYPYDPEKAMELLEEAGYGDSLSFTITVPSNYEPHVSAALVLAEQLKAVGINATIEYVEWATWLERVYQKHEFETTVVGFDASILSATAMLARWTSTSSSNMIGYNNTAYDKTYAQAVACTNDAEQTELYKECLEILSETAANVYLQDLAEFVAINPNLDGFAFYPLYVIDLSQIYWKA